MRAASASGRIGRWIAAAMSVCIWMAAAAMGDAQDDPQRFVRGAKAWSEHCGRCHNLRDASDFPDAEWDVIVNHMRARANLPGDMARDIETYLKAAN